MRWGLTLLRLIVGGTFMAHGAQKLFGAFGGPGLEATAQGFEQGLQMAPGKRNALVASVSELGGGALLVAGAATPVATTALTSTMTTAIWKVHKAKGFFISEGGFEFNLLLLGALFVLADEGPGALALGDSEARGALWGFAQLATGVAGAFGAMELGRREAERLAAAAGSSNGGPGQARADEPAAASASA